MLAGIRKKEQNQLRKIETKEPEKPKTPAKEQNPIMGVIGQRLDQLKPQSPTPEQSSDNDADWDDSPPSSPISRRKHPQ
jgi:hypothetical protein